MQKRSSRPDGSEFAEDTLQEESPERSELLAEAHAPARRVDVREEARSVVIAEEVDDDKTPPRGYRYRFASSPDLEVHSEEEVLSDPLPRFDDLTPSDPLPKQLESLRCLPSYDHRYDPTIVLPRRPKNWLLALLSQLAPHQFYVVVAAVIVTGCAAAFIVGAAIISLFQPASPQPAAVVPQKSVAVPSVVVAPPVDSADAPVTLTDLPVVEE